MEQLPDFSITPSQKEYIHRILAIDIGKSRREQPDSPASETEKTKLRELVGSLPYAVSHSRPDLASRLGEVQAQMAQPKVSTLMLYITKYFVRHNHFPMSKSVFVTWILKRSLMFHLETHRLQAPGNSAHFTRFHHIHNHFSVEAPISPVSWSSRKRSRVVRSPSQLTRCPEALTALDG